MGLKQRRKFNKHFCVVWVGKGRAENKEGGHLRRKENIIKWQAIVPAEVGVVKKSVQMNRGKSQEE